MSKIMDKVLGFMGFEEEEVEILDDEEVEANENEESGKRKKGGNIFSLHSQKNMKVVVCEPRVFEDCQSITDNLKNRRPVIVNLENADKDLSKRVIDFICGATYALSGHTQKVGNNIFLFVPSNMDIASEFNSEKDKEKEKGLFTWVR